MGQPATAAGQGAPSPSFRDAKAHLVARRPKEPHADTVVFAAVCRANGDGASLSQLGRDAGLDAKTVRAAVDRLVENGECVLERAGASKHAAVTVRAADGAWDRRMTSGGTMVWVLLDRLLDLTPREALVLGLVVDRTHTKRIRDGREFFASSRTIGELLDLTPKAVTNIRGRLRRSGFLGASPRERNNQSWTWEATPAAFTPRTQESQPPVGKSGYARLGNPGTRGWEIRALGVGKSGGARLGNPGALSTSGTPACTPSTTPPPNPLVGEGAGAELEQSPERASPPPRRAAPSTTSRASAPEPWNEGPPDALGELLRSIGVRKRPEVALRRFLAEGGDEDQLRELVALARVQGRDPAALLLSWIDGNLDWQVVLADGRAKQELEREARIEREYRETCEPPPKGSERRRAFVEQAIPLLNRLCTSSFADLLSVQTWAWALDPERFILEFSVEERCWDMVRAAFAEAFEDGLPRGEKVIAMLAETA